MSYLNDRTLRNILPELIKPYNSDNIKGAAYELTLGNQYFVTGEENSVAKTIIENGQIILNPGQTALLLTAETVRIPTDKIGFISIKAGIKFKGLVNISGFHVDPGYKGQLLFSVYNAGGKEIILQSGKPYFLLWFAELTGENTPYSNTGITEITAGFVENLKGEVVSPIVLKNELKAFEQRLSLHDYFVKTAIGLFIGIVVTIGIKFLYDRKGDGIVNIGTNAQKIDASIDSFRSEIISLRHENENLKQRFTQKPKDTIK